MLAESHPESISIGGRGLKNTQLETRNLGETLPQKDQALASVTAKSWPHPAVCNIQKESRFL